MCWYALGEFAGRYTWQLDSGTPCRNDEIIRQTSPLKIQPLPESRQVSEIRS